MYGVEPVLPKASWYSDIGRTESTSSLEQCSSTASLSQREALALALLFERATALDTLLLVLELGALAVELLLHLAMTGVELLL